MKIDFISCTKYLYVAEKISNDNFFELPAKDEISDEYATQFGMTPKELSMIWDQFEHDKIFITDEVYTEIEDNYGKTISEMSYESLLVDKKEIEKLIEHLKYRYALRKTPFISREELVSIACQIEKTISKDSVIKVLSNSSDTSHSFYDKTYTLTDFLFRHSYARGSVTPLYAILAEFLNPIYYGIGTEEIAERLFEYINKILSMTTIKSEYGEWLKRALKYIKPRKVIVEPLVGDRLYITKDGDDFYYNGKYLDISKKSNYYKVFYALYSKLPNGGEISYKDLILEICSRIPGKKRETSDKLTKFIQNNLTSKHNGFVRYAKIQNTEDSGKPLIDTAHGFGIVFNNTKK
jgi:hypothetical protein